MWSFPPPSPSPRHSQRRLPARQQGSSYSASSLGSGSQSIFNTPAPAFVTGDFDMASVDNSTDSEDTPPASAAEQKRESIVRRGLGDLTRDQRDCGMTAEVLRENDVYGASGPEILETYDTFTAHILDKPKDSYICTLDPLSNWSQVASTAGGKLFNKRLEKAAAEKTLDKLLPALNHEKELAVGEGEVVAKMEASYKTTVAKMEATHKAAVAKMEATHKAAVAEMDDSLNFHKLHLRGRKKKIKNDEFQVAEVQHSIAMLNRDIKAGEYFYRFCSQYPATPEESKPLARTPSSDRGFADLRESFDIKNPAAFFEMKRREIDYHIRVLTLLGYKSSPAYASVYRALNQELELTLHNGEVEPKRKVLCSYFGLEFPPTVENSSVTSTPTVASANGNGSVTASPQASSTPKSPEAAAQDMMESTYAQHFASPEGKVFLQKKLEEGNGEPST